MRIKKLEIFGFKSFAERAILNFDSGVTGVVGPNGCGKSNIVDALRWVMGEQSAKHLRGGQMQDIIFNGSTSRGPLGYAEVTLTLENDGQNVPPEYAHFSEIQVARRLYRTGDSEYEINRRPCRLRDIMDVFLGTGVGTRAYSIIEQGRVSAIVSAKPEERRQMIEEAAGITKYKVRRAAAERKMESTQQNLMRISDVKNELESRLDSLEKQAKKAERYKALQHEIRETELHFGALRYLEIFSTTQYLGQCENTHQQTLAELTSKLESLETQIQSERDILTDEEKKLSLTQGLLYEVENAIALTKQDMAFLSSSSDTKKRQSVQVAEEIRRLQLRHTDLRAEKTSYLNEKVTITEEFDHAQDALDEASQALRLLQQSRSEHMERVQILQRAVSDFATTAARTQSQIQVLEKRREEAKHRQQSLEREQLASADLIIKLDERFQILQAELTQGQQKRLELTTCLAELKSQLEQKRHELSAVTKQKQQLAQDIAGQKSRLSSLQEIEQGYEWSSEGVSSIMQQHSSERILGLLADFIEAPPELEQLVENVLRHQLETIVVKSKDDAIELARKLTQTQSGRVRFYTAEKSLRPHTFDSALIPGYRLIARLKILRDQDALIHHTLGNIFVVPNTDVALENWPMTKKAGITLVTPDGEVFDCDGSITGGTRPKTSGVLGRKREIREIEQELEGLHSSHITVIETEESLIGLIAELTSSLDMCRSEEQNLSISIVRFEETVLAKKNERDRIMEQEEKLLRDAQETLLFLRTSENELATLKQNWSDALEQHNSREEEFDNLTDQTRTIDDNLAQKSELTTTLRIQVASTRERVANLERASEQVTKNIDDIGHQLGNLERQEVELSEEQVTIANKQQASIEKMAVATGERETIASLLANQRSVYDERAALLRTNEQQTSSLRKEQEHVRSILNDLILQKETQKLSMGALFERLRERYDLSPLDILTDYHHRMLPEYDFEQKLNSLRRSVDNLGPINPNAITEFDELNQRYIFLKSQSDDLANALQQLEAAILRIDKTTHIRFEEAYHAINDRFSQVFPRLFRGGKAWLELTNPEDMLNTGVEIYAQPPGKKLGSIVLMSGGEKALTAISLIFAIFLIKPSPFCLLDEVDAPLDEANVERFSQLVKEMSSISQFIVITHNKRSMEVVDQLYGITMEEPGASKTVNVRVQESKPLHIPSPAEASAMVGEG